MKTLPLELAAPGYWDNTLNDGDGHINFYSELCKAKWRLVTTPGLPVFVTVANNLPCRGAHQPTRDISKCFSVNGTAIYSIAYVSGGVATACTGALDATAVSNNVEMCSNISHLFIIDGLFGYYMDLATETIVKITDANFVAAGAPISCAFINSRFIVSFSQNDTFFESALDDPSTWTPIVFAEAEISGDEIAGLITGGDRLHILGTASYQVFAPSEGSNPLVNINGASLAIGGQRWGYNWAYFKEALYFICSDSGAQKGQVFRIVGGALQRISTRKIEDLLRSWVCLGFCYTYQGQDFYEIINGSSTVGAPSVLYNITANSWHQTGSEWPGSLTRRRLRVVLNAAPGMGNPLAFDAFDGRIYKLSPDCNTEEGVPILRKVSFVVEATNDTVYHSILRLALEVKLDTGTSYSMQVSLSWSDDGGATYNTGVTKAVLVTGLLARKAIVQFENLGSSLGERRYYLKFVFPGYIAIRSADITLDKGGF